MPYSYAKTCPRCKGGLGYSSGERALCAQRVSLVSTGPVQRAQGVVHAAAISHTVRSSSFTPRCSAAQHKLNRKQQHGSVLQRWNQGHACSTRAPARAHGVPSLGVLSAAYSSLRSRPTACAACNRHGLSKRAFGAATTARAGAGAHSVHSSPPQAVREHQTCKARPLRQ